MMPRYRWQLTGGLLSVTAFGVESLVCQMLAANNVGALPLAYTPLVIHRAFALVLDGWGVWSRVGASAVIPNEDPQSWRGVLSILDNAAAAVSCVLLVVYLLTATPGAATSYLAALLPVALGNAMQVITLVGMTCHAHGSASAWAALLLPRCWLIALNVLLVAAAWTFESTFSSVAWAGLIGYAAFLLLSGTLGAIGLVTGALLEVRAARRVGSRPPTPHPGGNASAREQERECEENAGNAAHGSRGDDSRAGDGAAARAASLDGHAAAQFGRPRGRERQPRPGRHARRDRQDSHYVDGVHRSHDGGLLVHAVNAGAPCRRPRDC